MIHHANAPPDYTASLPPYTPEVGTSQCVGSPSTEPLQEYKYKLGSLKLNLGPKRHGLFRPAYGWNGTVQGFVKVKKNVKHVKSIIVSIEGMTTTGLSERGFMTEMTKTQILQRSHTLFDDSSGPFPASGAEYAFSLPLPSYITGGTNPLPPTFSATQPGIGSDVTYFVKIELIRNGRWRKNERLKAFFFYLPRTYASLPRCIPGTEKLDESNGWHLSSIPPQIRRGGTATSILSVTVAFPLPLEYPTLSPIPFCLTIAFSSETAALPLLLSGLSVQLVRITVLRIGERQSCSEMIVGGGEVYRIQERENLRTIFGSVQCTKEGESTWAAAGIKIKHVIRVRLAPPENMQSLASLPTYVYNQNVIMRTRQRSLQLTNEDEEWEPELAKVPRFAITA